MTAIRAYCPGMEDAVLLMGEKGYNQVPVRVKVRVSYVTLLGSRLGLAM
jgi:hypothetical protein